MQYSIKSTKIIHGDRGDIISTTLYKNGKKIATYLDHGDGSESGLEFVNKSVMDAFIEDAKAHGLQPSYYKGVVIESLLQYDEILRFYKKQWKRGCVTFHKTAEDSIKECFVAKSYPVGAIPVDEAYLATALEAIFDKELRVWQELKGTKEETCWGLRV
jgi:hypothetical protein